MTSEEMEKLLADLADLDARRAHDHDDPVRLAHPLVAMFDEATVRKLLAALDEETKRAEAARRMLDCMADESHVFNTILENTQRERDEARAQLALAMVWGAELADAARCEASLRWRWEARTDEARRALSIAETKSAGADVIVADAEARRVAAEMRAIEAERRVERLERENAELRDQANAYNKLERGTR